MEKSIKIKKQYLIFRQDAKKLATMGASSWDFSLAQFISRSFADELLSVIARAQKEHRHIRIVGLKPNLQKFLAIVKRSRQRIQKEVLSAR